MSELKEPFEIFLPGELQHLQVLEASGLVESQKVGRVRTCSLRAEALLEADDWIARRRTLWKPRPDRLGHHLAARGEEGGKGSSDGLRDRRAHRVFILDDP